MLSNKDEVEIKKLVSFYSIFSSVFFSILLVVLFWTNGIYSAGKYKFISVILFIVIAEIVKYFSSLVYLKTHDVNLGRKYSEKSIASIIRCGIGKSWLKDGFQTIAVTLLLLVVYFVIAILYGAEIFSKHEETLMFSGLLSVLTVFPACVNLGSQSVFALLLGSKPINKLESLLYQNLCFTIFGAWLGTFVIPLDWDRPWQVWPIPCSLGALIGYVLSHFFMLFQVNSGLKKKNKKLHLFQK